VFKGERDRGIRQGIIFGAENDRVNDKEIFRLEMKRSSTVVLGGSLEGAACWKKHCGWGRYIEFSGEKGSHQMRNNIKKHMRLFYNDGARPTRNEKRYRSSLSETSKGRQQKTAALLFYLSQLWKGNNGSRTGGGTCCSSE